MMELRRDDVCHFAGRLSPHPRARAGRVEDRASARRNDERRIRLRAAGLGRDQRTEEIVHERQNIACRRPVRGERRCGSAEEYPSRPVTLVAPSGPGSAPDVLSRIVAQKLLRATRPTGGGRRPAGAGGNIATQVVAQAAPDGHTVLLGTIANTLNPHIMTSVGYRLEDFAFASSVAAAPDVLVVHPSVPATTVQELIAFLKASPVPRRAMPASARPRTCPWRYSAAQPALKSR